jgi:hypothetical protein
VAGHLESGLGYIVPAYQMFEDMLNRLGKTLALVQKPLALTYTLQGFQETRQDWKLQGKKEGTATTDVVPVVQPETMRWDERRVQNSPSMDVQTKLSGISRREVRSTDLSSPVDRSVRIAAYRPSSNTEFTTNDNKWGRLFDSDRNPTPRLGQFLRGLANQIVAEYEPKNNLFVTPDQLAIFYAGHTVENEAYDMICKRKHLSQFPVLLTCSQAFSNHNHMTISAIFIRS